VSLGITGICAECKAPFEVKRRTQRFCKRTCRDDYQNRLKRTCPHCGKAIIIARTRKPTHFQS